MAGMETKAAPDRARSRSYDGLSANYSGAGFSGMRFKAIATTDQGFGRTGSPRIRATNKTRADAQAYADLARRASVPPVTLYSTAPTGMFDFIMHNQMSKLAGVTRSTARPPTRI